MNTRQAEKIEKSFHYKNSIIFKNIYIAYGRGMCSRKEVVNEVVDNIKKIGKTCDFEKYFGSWPEFKEV